MYEVFFCGEQVAEMTAVLSKFGSPERGSGECCLFLGVRLECSDGVTALGAFAAVTKAARKAKSGKVMLTFDGVPAQHFNTGICNTLRCAEAKKEG